MIDEIYNRRILAYAADIPHLGRLAQPDATAVAHSKLCGSKVTVDVKMKDGVVTDFAQDVKACALGQASSSIMGRHVIGSTAPELRALREQMYKMLKEEGAAPGGKWAELEALDSKVAEGTQTDAILKIWALLRHMTRWLLNRPGGTLDIAANVERYQGVVSDLRKALPHVLGKAGQGDFTCDREKWEGLGMPSALALRLARMPDLRAALDMAEIARQSDEPIEKVARIFYELGEALDLGWLRDQIEALPVEGHWHAQARGSLLDELNQQHRALAQQVLSMGVDDSGDVSAVQAWLQRDDATLQHTRSMLAEILTQNADYPIASVAVRRLAQLAQLPV